LRYATSSSWRFAILTGELNALYSHCGKAFLRGVNRLDHQKLKYSCVSFCFTQGGETKSFFCSTHSHWTEVLRRKTRQPAKKPSPSPLSEQIALRQKEKKTLYYSTAYIINAEYALDKSRQGSGFP